MPGSFEDKATTKNQKPQLLIAIDGTAGAGKTTIGQMLAARLVLPYLDTGAMYRAVTWLALQQKVALAPPDPSRLVEISRNLDFITREASPSEATDGRQYTVLVDGQDVSHQLRSSEVEQVVSLVAAIPQVRNEMVKRQREIGRLSEGGIVMIGRDIGSVVLPEAQLKVYLDASPEVRASRRSRQEIAQNTEEARRSLEKRDQIDSQRQEAPLVVAPGALVISTDNLNQQQVLERIEMALAPLIPRPVTE